MNLFLLCSRLILACVLVVAGVTKLTDQSGTRSAMASFGLPQSLASVITISLPMMEILLAWMLLPLATAWHASLLVFALFSVFQAAIAFNLLQGRTPECHCFGQLHSKPLSWGLFGRNTLLLALAGLIICYGPGLSAFAWLSHLTTAESVSLLLNSACVGLILACFLALRSLQSRQANLLLAVESLKNSVEGEGGSSVPSLNHPAAVAPGEGLPVGMQAPEFSLLSISGQVVSLADLIALRKWIVLVIISTNCGSCRNLLPQIYRWEREYRDYLALVLVCKGPDEEVQKRIKPYGIELLLLHQGSGLAETYQAPWTPTALLIDMEGKIASPVRAGIDAIRALVQHTVTIAAKASQHPVFLPDIHIGNSPFKLGEPAPRFTTTDLRGNQVGLEQLLGHRSLLLFWASDCPYCIKMQGHFIRWKKDAPKDAPDLVILASGDKAVIEKNLSHHNFLVLLDIDFQIGPIFGITNTPSGVLIDEEGRISSSIASGARHVLAIAGVPYIEPPVAVV